MTLDVIVVSYGSGRLLERCLSGVRAFAGRDAQIVVVDNGPLNARLERPRVATPHTVIENDTNRGYAAAVNQGVAAGSGELVLLLNPDVEEIRGSFGQIEHAFASQVNVAAITPRLVAPNGDTEPTRRREPRPFDLVAETLDLARRFPKWERPRRFRMLDVDDDRADIVDAATGACLFLRRAALSEIGAFDESFFVYWEETDWLVRAKRQGWSTYYLPEIEAVHVGRGSTDVSDDALLLLLLEGQHTYSRKHYGRRTAIALRAVLAFVDIARLLMSFLSRRVSTRAAMQRRLRVHLTGRAPRPSDAQPSAEVR